MTDSMGVGRMLRDRAARGWRAALYLLAGLGSAMVAMAALPLVLLAAGPALAGFDPARRALAPLRRWAHWELDRARRCAAPRTGHDPRRPAPAPAVGRALRWLPAHAVLGAACGMVGLLGVAGPPAAVLKTATWWLLPGEVTFLGVAAETWGPALVGGSGELVLGTAIFLWGAPALAGAYARLATRMLSPSAAELREAELSERVQTLTHTRSEAVQAHGSELRRIERDLHDGAQARLVSLAMHMGLAERIAAEDPEQAVRLLREARGNAEAAMTELRDVVRTMYPPILSDRGLAGAVSALAARSPVPTEVRAAELNEVPAAVEAAGYFAIAEALTNVAKHAHATSASVDVERSGDTLRIAVRDDGVGGADAGLGTGISGIRGRVAALDGTLSVDSPGGGPTVIVVELPCAS